MMKDEKPRTSTQVFMAAREMKAKQKKQTKKVVLHRDRAALGHGHSHGLYPFTEAS